MTISQEQAERAASAYREHGSVRLAAKALDVSKDSLHRHLKRAAEKGLTGYAPVMLGFQIKSVASKEGDAWVKQTKEHGEEFALPDGHVTKGVSALVDAEGRVIQQWIKTGTDADRASAVMLAAAAALAEDLPRVPATPGPTSNNADLLNQYVVTDQHMGMLAWSEETGDADYDLKIAEALIVDWFAAAIAMSPAASTAVFAQLGDLMHHDAFESVTPTSKHVLDADSRLQKIIRVVIRCVRQIIGMLAEKHERVHVIMAAANHDPASGAWLREMLHAMYEDEPRITIDNSPSEFYAFEHGRTALFYHHGHRRKVADVDHVFVAKFREIYGRCEHSYSHVGHLHSDAVVETNLMRSERHRTLAPKDAYASSHGYLSRRDAKVITYHKEFGEVSRITISPQAVDRRRAANDNRKQEKAA